MFELFKHWDSQIYYKEFGRLVHYVNFDKMEYLCIKNDMGLGEWNLEESLKKYFEMMEKSYNEILIKLEDVKKDSAHGFEKVKLTKEQ